MNRLKMLDQTDDKAIIGGYGVIFGGGDLDGETFTKDTDYMLDLVPRKLVFIDHALGFEMKGADGDVFKVQGIKESIGEIIEVTADDIGLYMKLQLEKASRYWQVAEAMIASGKAGLSTGTAGHLAIKNHGVIERWPILETSITLSPAEPRTIATVERIKAVVNANGKELATILEVDSPEAPRKGAAASATDQAPVDEPARDNPTLEPIKKLGDLTMNDKDKMTDKDQEPAVHVTADATPFVDMIEQLRDEVKAMVATMGTPTNDPGPAAKAASINYNSKTKLGDDEVKAFAHWARTGDKGAIKASNDTTMNITTDADGGYAVPTGHYQGIIARRDESLLKDKLGVRNIPGKGTTVNVPVDNEADGEFVATGESSAYDRDAPAIGQVAMTLAKYTKKVDLTVELLEDEDSKIMAFLNDFVGRGMAKTHNSLLLTEVAANGTSLKTFASATVIAVDELEGITFNDDLAPYLEDETGVAWVMKRSVHGEIASLDDANIRRYYNNQAGGPAELLGYPIFNSQKSGATAASTKSVYFGNWNYVGFREAPGFSVVRDPFTRAAYGEVVFTYMFRACYDVLVAEAIGYGVHPSA